MYHLINKEKTGTPALLAKKLNYSRTKLYEDIEFLKQQGWPISYSKKKRTFYFLRPCELEIKAEIKFLDNEETVNITGGYSTFFAKNDFFHLFL